MRRAAFEPIDVHGIEVQPDEQVVTMLGAANHEPRAFPDPDRFDIGRNDGQAMSFGAGIHFCLGAPLARAEGQVVLDRLLDRFSVIEPAWGDERPRYATQSCSTGSNRSPCTFPDLRKARRVRRRRHRRHLGRALGREIRRAGAEARLGEHTFECMRDIRRVASPASAMPAPTRQHVQRSTVDRG